MADSGRCRSPERLALLEQALTALDRADQAREQLAKGGVTSTTEKTGTLHVHPLVRIERENRQLFARIWGQLGLAWDADIDGGWRDLRIPRCLD